MASQKFCSAAFVVRNHQFLLGKRSGSSDWYKSVWDVFGGHSERNEHPSDTLKRELQEELGIIPTHYDLYD
jgi:8-oxo-dGTP pyrophosphatase MutT (NUDIX family)